MLSESYELNRKLCHEPQSHPFPQSHSFPLDVRHNLLLSKESASSSCKAAYPFVQGSELVAVQIIAVDTERNSGLRKAGYLMKAGYPNQNTVSTGDLNRGRRVKPRLLFGSFCRSKKNKPVSLSGAFHCMESMPLSGRHAARAFVAARKSSGRRGAAPYLYMQSVYAACFLNILRRQSRLLGVPFRELFTCF